MTLEDFLAKHPGWRVEQRSSRPWYRAVHEERANCSVTGDTIADLDAKFGRCVARVAA